MSRLEPHADCHFVLLFQENKQINVKRRKPNKKEAFVFGEGIEL